jgi:hypothetical protein
MRQCQYKIKCMFLDFAIQGFFMGTIMTFYVITLYVFPIGFQEFLHMHIIYKSLDFFY